MSGRQSAASPDAVQCCVESLCAAGCDVVRAHITAFEMGAEVAAAAHLDDESRARVLGELRAIMACYDHRYSSVR